MTRVKWYTDTLLEITLVGDPDDMPKWTKQVEEILIDYRRLDK